MKQFANTEPSRLGTAESEAKSGKASKGLERDGYKPLMRNRTGEYVPSPTGSTDSATNFTQP